METSNWGGLSILTLVCLNSRFGKKLLFRMLLCSQGKIDVSNMSNNVEIRFDIEDYPEERQVNNNRLTGKRSEGVV